MFTNQPKHRHQKHILFLFNSREFVNNIHFLFHQLEWSLCGCCDCFWLWLFHFKILRRFQYFHRSSSHSTLYEHRYKLYNIYNAHTFFTLRLLRIMKEKKCERKANEHHKISVESKSSTFVSKIVRIHINTHTHFYSVSIFFFKCDYSDFASNFASIRQFEKDWLDISST